MTGILGLVDTFFSHGGPDLAPQLSGPRSCALQDLVVSSSLDLQFKRRVSMVLLIQVVHALYKHI